MKKYILALAVAVLGALGILAAALSNTPTSVTGSWRVDSRQSYAQIITDGTTDFGKKKIDLTLGYARLNGVMSLDESDPAKSHLDFRMYPASSMAPQIGEDGKVQAKWFENLANQTLICFHSTSVVLTPEGKLKVAGNLTLTRVDRNVDAAPGEAYSGPVYGPPMIHRVSHEATFVFDLSAPAGTQTLVASTSTKVFREDFPQLARAIVSTAWPPLVQNQSCEAPAPGEAYSGQKCTGTYLTPRLPASPSQAGEDYPGSMDFNAVTGERVTFQVQMRLNQASKEQAAAGN